MKKLKILIPLAILFASPWFHWAVYHNLMAAWPDMDHSAAHFVGIAGAGIAFAVSFGIMGGI